MGLWFICVTLRDQREIYWGASMWKLLEYSYVNILPQITQITQIRNAAGYIIPQRKTVCLVNVALGFVFLWFVCDYLRDLRETSGVSSGYIA